MNYKQFEQLTDESYKRDVWELLCKYDHTFIPALSSRQSTSQSKLDKDIDGDLKPELYYENILKQSIIVAITEDTNKVVGFMSYKPSYKSDDLMDDIDTIYITTIIVDEAYRGNGITSTFYSLIEAIGIANKKPIMTRTWSTNDAHIHVLAKKGLKEIKRLANARGAGIDTVYYRKHLGG